MLQTIDAIRVHILILSLCSVAVACSTPPAPPRDLSDAGTPLAPPEYIIGPLDRVQIYVAGTPELSGTVPVRPDGRVSTPLVQDMLAAGKTPTELADDLQNALLPYVQEPEVSVVVQDFADTSAYTVRVMGAVANPRPVPYRPYMTVLDAMVAAGGLGEFAAGNRSVLIRGQRGANEEVYRLRLEDLLTDADLSANAPVQPGDVIIVPESLL